MRQTLSIETGKTLEQQKSVKRNSLASQGHSHRAAPIDPLSPLSPRSLIFSSHVTQRALKELGQNQNRDLSLGLVSRKPVMNRGFLHQTQNIQMENQQRTHRIKS